VTGACFWYTWRQIDVSQIVSAIALLDFRWVSFATVMVVSEIPLLALRWTNVVAALEARNEGTTATTLIAITAIGQFFAQVLPSVAGDGVRALLWPGSVAIDATRWRGRGNRPCDRAGCARHVGPLAALFPLAGGLGHERAPGRARPQGPAVLAIGCLFYLLTIVVVWSHRDHSQLAQSSAADRDRNERHADQHREQHGGVGGRQQQAQRASELGTYGIGVSTCLAVSCLYLPEMATALAVPRAAMM
jgi:hypothetical protein